jgi:hypothetical protein
MTRQAIAREFVKWWNQDRKLDPTRDIHTPDTDPIEADGPRTYCPPSPLIPAAEEFGTDHRSSKKWDAL